MRVVVLAAALLIAPIAHAQDVKVGKAEKAFTIEQCINILTGLTSLSYAGQQLNDASRAPTDSKQYKLGPARMKIALNIASMTPVFTAAQLAQNGFISELPSLPTAKDDDKSKAQHDDAAKAQNKLVNDNWRKIIDQPCPVTPGRLSADDLKIGDGPEQNQIPPNVLAAISPIVDGLR